MQTAQEKLLAKLDGMSGARFASFTYAAKESGEIARHNVILLASYRNMLETDIASMPEILATLAEGSIDAVAGAEVLASLNQSLACVISGKSNPDYVCRDTFHATPVAGVKMHKVTGALYLNVLTISKVVLQDGTYKHVNHAEKTIAKKKIEKLLRKSHFRTFIIGNIAEARLEGDTIVLD